MANMKSEFLEFDHERTREAWNRVQLQELENYISYFPPTNSTNRSATLLPDSHVTSINRNNKLRGYYQDLPMDQRFWKEAEVPPSNSYYTLPNITMPSPNEPLLFPENFGRSKTYYTPEENIAWLSEAVELLPGISWASTPQQNTIRFSNTEQSAEKLSAYTPQQNPIRFSSTMKLAETSRDYPPQRNATRFNGMAELPEVGRRWRPDQGSWWNEGGYIPQQNTSSLCDAGQLPGSFRREEISRSYIPQQNASSFNGTMDLLDEVGRRLDQCSLNKEGKAMDYIPKYNTTTPSHLLDFQSAFNSRHNKLRADAPAFRSTCATENPASNSYYIQPNASNSMPASGEAGRRPNQNFVQLGGIRGVYARQYMTKLDNMVQLQKEAGWRSDQGGLKKTERASLPTFSWDISNDVGLSRNSSSSCSSSDPSASTSNEYSLTEEQRRLFLGFSRRVPNKYYRPTERNIPNHRGAFCNMCYKNCESIFYMTHNIKYPNGKVQCPVLRNLTCGTCAATGDFAHTKTYCPLQNREFKKQTYYYQKNRVY